MCWKGGMGVLESRNATGSDFTANYLFIYLFVTDFWM